VPALRRRRADHGVRDGAPLRRVRVHPHREPRRPVAGPSPTRREEERSEPRRHRGPTAACLRRRAGPVLRARRSMDGVAPVERVRSVGRPARPADRGPRRIAPRRLGFPRSGRDPLDPTSNARIVTRSTSCCSRRGCEITRIDSTISTVEVWSTRKFASGPLQHERTFGTMEELPRVPRSVAE
jgi:hypothetical protein